MLNEIPRRALPILLLTFVEGDARTRVFSISKADT